MNLYRGELPYGMGRQAPVEDCPVPQPVYWPMPSSWKGGYTWAVVIREEALHGATVHSDAGLLQR
jgi:hypothetical protein